MNYVHILQETEHILMVICVALTQATSSNIVTQSWEQ